MLIELKPEHVPIPAPRIKIHGKGDVRVNGSIQLEYRLYCRKNFDNGTIRSMIKFILWNGIWHKVHIIAD